MKNHGMVQNKMLTNKVIKKLLFLALAIFSFSALAVAVPDPVPEPVPTPVPVPAPTGTTVISFQYDAMGNRISQKNPSADIDGDGISDAWEITYFGNLNHDMSGDTDNDGLTDLEEYEAKTNPTLLDTDEDGIADGYELNNGMNPLDGADALVDTDNDGLPDAFEIFHGLNISDPNDVNTDNDGDGFTVWQEFYANTSDMDDTDKPTHSLLSFEDNAHESFYWLPQDNDAWLPDSNHSSGGGFSLRSSTVSSTTPTKLEVIINATGEPISFDVLGTEFFHQSAFIFYIDGEVKYINGFKEEAFNHLEFDLTPGKHRLTWYYGPLNYEVVVDDSFYIWLDNIVLPTVADSDSDGFKDSWEYLHFDSLSYGPTDDVDNDGLTNLEELNASTNPNEYDTDGDGKADGFELSNGMNPLDPLDELLDSDNDGLPDAFEIFHGLNINDASDANIDSDGDGYSILQEYLAGTSDTDPNEQPSASVMVDFEAGKIQLFYWLHQGDSSWQITQENTVKGSYSLQAGKVLNNQQSSIALTVSATGSPLSFYFSLDSAQDRFEFYIDGVLQATWNGTIDNKLVVYPLLAGKRRLEWVYKNNAVPAISTNTQSFISNQPGPLWSEPAAIRAMIDNINIPVVLDIDNDGVDDSWEYLYFDSLAYELSLDMDSDGLTELEEYQARTNPLLTDTDGDGITDGFELNNGMNPLDAADAQVDSDNDGLPDVFEIFHGLNINDPSDAATDNDGDGFNVWQEFKASTSDFDNLSRPEGTLIGFEEGNTASFENLAQWSGEWFVEQKNAHIGSYVLTSGELPINGESRFEMIITTLGGLVSFDVFMGNVDGSPASNSSRLTFYANGERIEVIEKGEYQHFTLELPAGTHALQWVFDTWGGIDAKSIWIDNLYLPAYVDSDSDGLPDFFEVLHGLDMNDPSDALVDADNDGFNVWQEYKASTSDNDDLDKPQGVIVGFEQQDELPLPIFGQKVNQWFVDDSLAFFGKKALRSGILGPDSKEAFELTIESNGAPISFSYYLGDRRGKVVADDDSYINFYVDGQRFSRGKIINQWVYVEHQLTAGTHTLKWEFDFDEDVGNANTVWLDNFLIPIEEDSDNDGVKDLWELSNFTHLNIDLNADSDGDGLTNITEYSFGSSPLLKDSDHDRLTDLQEYNIGTNPQLKDSDGDSKSDYFESNNGLDPLNSLDVLDDLDGDGLPDAFELFHQLDVNNSQDSLVDGDQDSFNRLAEYTAETSDTDAIEQPPLLIDFEEGTISDGNWTHSGDASWQISSVDPISGAYSLKSGVITHNQVSAIETTINSPGAIIAFDVTISSEEGYDYFNFYIDNELQLEWSDEFSEQQVTFQLAKGVHTLKWEYAKDGSADRGADAVLIDNVFLPTLRDIDDDGILDSWEIVHFSGLDHDMSLDSDGDGLTDKEEYLEKSNPTLKDTDGDNMADGWEKTQGLNLLINDAAGDINGDGRINLVEYIIDTPDYPVDIDSDGDGVPDVVEVQMGSNPTDPTSMENEINIITGTSLGDQLVGSNEADQILGLEGDDVIVGGLGNDEFDGGLGKDTFQFSLGDGHDVIKDTGGIDIIVFDASITAEMLSFTQQVEANLFTLIISINNSTDQIDIQNWKKNSFDKLVQIVFADGTTWSNSDIESKVVDILPPEKKILAPKYISGQLNRGRYRFPIDIHYTGNTSSDFAGLVAPSTVLGHVQADDDGQFTIEDIGLGIHHFEIPAGSKVARFSLRDESVTTEGSDLDLYVYQCKKGDCNKLVGKSLNINSNEDVILLNPEVANNQSEGDYYAVYVYGHSTGVAAGTDYSMSVWVADKVETTTRVISSLRAIVGRSNYVTILTRELAPYITYMGAVTFYNDLGVAEGTTVLELHNVE